MSGERQRRWERATELPLVGLALAFLVAYAWPILDPGLDSGWRAVCFWVTTLAWVVFAVDYLVRVRLSDDTWEFVRHHVLDLLVVLLPILRPLRLLRLVTVLTVLNRRAGSSLRGHVALYVGGGATLVILVSSLAVLDAERGRPGANIDGIGDALWWALTTVTTVGYGDQFPVSTTGRLIAAGLMLSGIALLGVVTAGLASWLIDRVREVEEESQLATRQDVRELAAEVAALRLLLERADE